MQRLVAWFMPKGLAADSPEGFKVQTIIWVSLMVGNSGFPFMVLLYWVENPQEATVILWSWVFFMLIPFLARRGMPSGSLAHLLAGNYYQCHLFLCMIWGGVEAPNTMWFAAIPIVSVLVGGIRHGFIWGCISVASVLGIYVLEEVTGHLVLNTSLLPFEHLFVLAMGTVALLAAVFGSTTAFEMLRLSAFERRVRAEDKLKRANDDLKVLDAQKTSFFQNVSHELRTPLTLILPPLTEAVRARPEDGQMRMAARNARRLLRLVNQLLTLQKMRAGPQRLDAEPIDVIGFLTISGDAFQSACAAKSISLSLVHNGRAIDDETERSWVLAELDSLEKIVFNFLSNALKFTPDGGAIELGASTRARRVRIHVRDTGPGIAPESRSLLFQEFSQVDSSATRAVEGTGLGLALAKSLATQLDGEVGVDSEVGVGSTFWVELPSTRPPNDSATTAFEPKEWLIDPVAEAEDSAQPRTDSPASPANGPLVLVVDDLADLRNLVANFLQRAGYRTLQAPNGRVALREAIRHRPDAIVTDWMMPEMTGAQLIQRVRQEPEIAGIPTVLLTAKSDEESRLMGTELGADAFVGKPFNEQELVSVVRNLIALKAGEREVERLNQRLTETVLKRYLPPPLVDRLIADDLELGAPELRTVTVLFSDICEFTNTSEDLGPATIARLLNDYLTAMTGIVFSFEGTIDKFIGDGMMVMFGAPIALDPVEQARRATACAAAMQNAMDAFADTCEAEGLPRLTIRVGIHQGEAVVGNFGSDQRFDYTCIGPMVNAAARIESQCPPGSIMISQAIREQLPDLNATDHGLFALKGIPDARRLYTVVPSGGKETAPV
ncbi:MAG: adenylate/guanylate cyclase domain-containing protein [Myxococcota bacterium]|nr:adenylate/guanylate cyclase domain-containing protein [Myxococcota bacterium]